MPFDATHDVIIVGSGAGGMSAALTARHFGANVLVLEKTEYIGGSTAISGGAVWVPQSPYLADIGLTDRREDVTAYLRAILGNRYRADVMDAFLDTGPEMVAFLKANPEVQFTPRAVSPDYQPERPGAAPGGRTIDPAPYDGRALGAHFALLRPPLNEFLVFGGMMVNKKDIDTLLGATTSLAKAMDAAKLVGRFLKDRLSHPRGTRLLMGNALAARLLKSALNAGIAITTRSTVRELILDGGRVAGVVAETNGVTRRIGARRGVVLATGGFPGSAVMRAAHVPYAENHYSMAPVGNSGDGIRMAEAAGAATGGDTFGNAFWTPVSVLKTREGKEIRFPHLILDRQKPGLVAVDQTGSRFVNEATSYHEFVEAMHRHGDAAIPAWLVCDAKFIRTYGLGLARPGPRSLNGLIKAGYLVTGSTIAALAKAMGVPAERLEQVFARMNDYARTGTDPEFGKGSTAYNRYLGDAAHMPNPCLGPIESAPFYAVKVWPGDIGTALGLNTNARAEVLDHHGSPIPGLYAAGNDMHSVMAGAYPSAGITLGPALTFGYIAGKQLGKA